MSGSLNQARREMFRRLLEEKGDRIYSFAVTLAGGEQEAADITAEAFARALKSFARYDPARPFESWLYKIVQNVYFDVKRRQKTRPTVSLDEADDGGDDRRTLGERKSDRARLPEQELAAQEERSMVRAALGRTPAVYREPLALCDLMGMSYEDISRFLRLPIGTVRSRIFRGRQILKKIIEPYYVAGGILWTAAKH
ncbi:MAG: sigma-70 family RNA polymerase sigma factor [Elusimicrobiota bacterium]